MSEEQKQFLFLFLINFFFFFGINSMNMLPAYLSAQGAGTGLIGAFNTVPILFLVFLVVIQLIRGRTYHKLLMIRAGFLFTIAGASGMLVFRGNLPLMFCFYLLTGFSYGTGFTNLFSMMYDIVPAEKRRSYSALFGISGLMTSGLAAIIAQQIYYEVAPYAIFYLPLFFSAFAFILSWQLKADKFILIEDDSFSFIRFNKKTGIGRLVFQALAFGGGFGIFKTFIPLFTQQRLGFVDITRFFLFFTIAGIFYRLVFSRFMDKFSRRFIQSIGFILMISTILALGWITKSFQLYIIGAVYGLAHSFLFPVLSAEFVRVGDENRAAYNNIFLAVFTFGTTISASGLGFLADYLGLKSIPYAISIVLFAALISLFTGIKDHSNQHHS